MENLLTSNVSAIIDLVALALILMFALIGLKKGFAKTFISTFGTFISLVLASLLASTAAEVLQNNFGIIESIGNRLSGFLTNLFGDTLMNTTLEQASEANMAEAGVFGWVIRLVLNLQNGGEIPVDTTLNQIICPVIAYYIVLIIAFVVLYILFKLALFLFGEFILKLHFFNTVRRFDKGLGFLFGLVQGVLVFELIVIIIGIIPVGFFQNIYSEICDATVSGFLTRINLFAFIISSLSSVGSVPSIITSIIN